MELLPVTSWALWTLITAEPSIVGGGVTLAGPPPAGPRETNMASADAPAAHQTLRTFSCLTEKDPVLKRFGGKMKMNGCVFNCLSEVDSLQPGGGIVAHATWTCRNGSLQMTFVLLDSRRVEG